MKGRRIVMKEPRHRNDLHIQDMQLIYDGYDSEVNGRCYNEGEEM